jgi:pyrroloquinoline quinone biosynthesis protein D
MITPEAMPRLAQKARLRFDRHSQRHLLVYPDRGMLLNATAAAILELCTGEHSVDQIVEQLHARAAGATRSSVEHDVHTFLESMLERRLIHLDARAKPEPA